jgi:hypothetical protein
MMKILGHEYGFVKVGDLYVATTNLYYPELAIHKQNSQCYFDFCATEKANDIVRRSAPTVRISTRDDLKYLGSLGSHWVEAGERGNEIAGRFFGEHCKEATITDLKGCVFFPACGIYNGALLGKYGSLGLYWSSTSHDDCYGYHMYFDNESDISDVHYVYMENGRPVRLVSTENHQ